MDALTSPCTELLLRLRMFGAGVSLDVDVSILSISTTKSLLPHTCTVPHVPQAASLDISAALSPVTGEPALSGMRAYLAVSRKLTWSPPFRHFYRREEPFSPTFVAALLWVRRISRSRDGACLLQVMREVSSRSRHDGTATGEGTAAGHCCFEISKEAEDHAQRDFVACRRSDRNLKAADLHRWLTMARLFALSHGDTKVRTRC
jgi:hypothetical protein